MSLPKVEIFSDGACLGNPGAGGWGTVLVFQNNGKTVTRELSGGKTHTTNNEMEFEAVFQGLLALKRACYVTVYTDSQLVVGYMCRGWKGNKPHLLRIKANITALCNEMGHQVEYVKVKGHAGAAYNELADALFATIGGVLKGWSFNLGSVQHPFAERIVNYYRKAAADTFVVH